MPVLKTPVVPNNFALSFSSARKEFLSLANTALDNLPGQILHFNYPVSGPSGERLSSDWLWLGENRAPSVLVMISGTHGIEGFAGSGLQRQILPDLVQLLLQQGKLAVLLIHSLNPWGYAWHRRTDHHNIDLNRNFVDFRTPVPDNTGYRLIEADLLSDREVRQAKLHQWEKELGRRDYEQAISSGQYSSPDGLFYGGIRPSWGNNTLVSGLSTLSLAHAKRIVVLDIHSGLGPYGYGELISDHPLHSAGDKLSHRWFGYQVSHSARGNSFSVPKTGLIDFFFHEVIGNRGCFLTYEMGSFGNDALFDLLCQDQYEWNKIDMYSDEEKRKQLMLEHFCPSDPHWQYSVSSRFRQLVGISVDALLGSH
ncbi:DUF2817 domain-containing protein [Oceanospirillum sediminis]|uniref:DUF2817 domain-containing protein n=1 Tax=Oceanospirillum sediminis TaxID=2760088 RepID=A0A839ISH2_9GAMM|nr:DUF2817 domain-containing protein [Oceanospirillum sediminis]MBB1487502.1 DUF2817 domain-containing protein [Oceanospirillum sediminis]